MFGWHLGVGLLAPGPGPGGPQAGGDGEQQLLLLHGEDVVQLQHVQRGVEPGVHVGLQQTLQDEHHRVLVQTVDPLVSSPGTGGRIRASNKYFAITEKAPTRAY